MLILTQSPLLWKSAFYGLKMANMPCAVQYHPEPGKANADISKTTWYISTSWNGQPTSPASPCLWVLFSFADRDSSFTGVYSPPPPPPPPQPHSVNEVKCQNWHGHTHWWTPRVPPAILMGSWRRQRGCVWKGQSLKQQLCVGTSPLTLTKTPCPPYTPSIHSLLSPLPPHTHTDHMPAQDACLGEMTSRNPVVTVPLTVWEGAY